MNSISSTIAKVKNYPKGFNLLVSIMVWITEVTTIPKSKEPKKYAINVPILRPAIHPKDSTSEDGMKTEKVICQNYCPNMPVIICIKAHMYSPSVTPNWPTFVWRTPVLYYIQLEVQKTAWHAVNITKTSVVSSLAAWHMARMKKVIEKESQPWSNNCPNGELDLVLRACFPSIASRVE